MGEEEYKEEGEGEEGDTNTDTEISYINKHKRWPGVLPVAYMWPWRNRARSLFRASEVFKKSNSMLNPYDVCLSVCMCVLVQYICMELWLCLCTSVAHYTLSVVSGIVGNQPDKIYLEASITVDHAASTHTRGFIMHLQRNTGNQTQTHTGEEEVRKRVWIRGRHYI